MQDLVPDDETRCGFDPNKMFAYSTFLEQNSKDKVVMDVGTGPGVLAFLALSFGAKKVICVDYRSEALVLCKALLEKNFPGQAEYIQSDIRNVTDFAEVDFIIHEILGHAIYDEGILGILSHFRNYNVLDKVYPNYYEMFTYNHNNTTSKSYYQYDPADFPGSVRRYIDAYKEIVPNVFDILNIPRRRLANSKVDIEYENIIHTFSHNDPIETWGIIDENKLTIDDTGMVGIGWRAFFDHTLNFANVPRKGNNWTPLFYERDKKYLSRSAKVVIKKLNYKLFEREQCPFLK